MPSMPAEASRCSFSRRCLQMQLKPVQRADRVEATLWLSELKTELAVVRHGPLKIIDQELGRQRSDSRLLCCHCHQTLLSAAERKRQAQREAERCRLHAVLGGV